MEAEGRGALEERTIAANRLILSTFAGRYWEGRIQGAYNAGVAELTARTWSYSWVLPLRLGDWHETGRHWQGDALSNAQGPVGLALLSDRVGRPFNRHHHRHECLEDAGWAAERLTERTGGERASEPTTIVRSRWLSVTKIINLHSKRLTPDNDNQRRVGDKELHN